MENFSINELFLIGAHYGKKKRFSHPGMNPYVYTVKKGSGTKIINLEKTLASFQNLAEELKTLIASDKKILFVSTKPKIANFLQQTIQRTDHFYVNRRWWGGTLTNLPQVHKRIAHLKTLIKQENSDYFAQLTKRERLQFTKQKTALSQQLQGLLEMHKLPDALFVVDPVNEKIACQEANKLGIPIFALANTNANPAFLTNFIVMNDTSERVIIFFLIQILQRLFPTIDWNDLKVPERPERKTRKGRRFEDKKKPTSTISTPVAPPKSEPVTATPTPPTPVTKPHFATNHTNEAQGEKQVGTADQDISNTNHVNNAHGGKSQHQEFATHFSNIVADSKVKATPTDEKLPDQTADSVQPQSHVTSPLPSKVDLKLLKKLRSTTLASLTACHKALSMHDNDYAAALTWLEKHRKVVVDQNRVNDQGLVATFISTSQNQAVICNLKCETDFVARNSQFQTVFQTLSQELANAPQLNVVQAASLAQPFCQKLINQFGENITFGPVIILTKKPHQHFAFYNHNNWQQTALLLVEAPEFKADNGAKLAMHVVAMQPTYISIDQITPAVLAAWETQIRTNVAQNQQLPQDPQIQARIIAGQLKKRFQATVLLEQAFVHEPQTTLQRWLATWQGKVLQMFYKKEGN